VPSLTAPHAVLRQGAIAKFSKAIFLSDQRHEFFEARGMAYYHLRDYKTAVSNFKHALKLRGSADPGELGRLTSNLLDADGLSRLKFKEFDEAAHLFSQALLVDPSNAYVYVHRALAFVGQGKVEEAIKGMKVYLDKDTASPASAVAIHILAARLNRQLKNSTAAAVHVQVPSSAPDTPHTAPPPREVRRHRRAGGAEDRPRERGRLEALLAPPRARVRAVRRGNRPHPQKRAAWRHRVALHRSRPSERVSGSPRESTRNISFIVNDLLAKLNATQHPSAHAALACIPQCADALGAVAIALDNADARFLVRRGVIHRQLGAYNEAVADLENVAPPPRSPPTA